jgi:hypothetical protein
MNGWTAVGLASSEGAPATSRPRSFKLDKGKRGDLTIPAFVSVFNNYHCARFENLSAKIPKCNRSV